MSVVPLAQFVKNNIQVAYVHMRLLTMNGILKDFLKKKEQ